MQRAYFLDKLIRLAEPVLVNLAQGTLRQAMPVEMAVNVADDRRRYSHLEAFGRLMVGLAPWLELSLLAGAEADLQEKYRALAQKALHTATNPASPDFLNFNQGQQCLVDAAFLAQAVLRAPNALWKTLPTETQSNLSAALRSTRVIRPFYNNWLLFSACLEAALCSIGEPWDEMRVDYALRQMEQWYKGDGAYGDGPGFHWDYYNGFVIQPMLLDILRTVHGAPLAFEGFYVSSQAAPSWEQLYERVLRRARRFAEIQERLIAPDGSYPPIGRSLAYRCGAFQLLGQMALWHELPPTLTPAQVRCALGAVIHRTLDVPGTFDGQGWLQIGLAGYQPSIGEEYVSTGSLYLCAACFLPLGLPPQDEFWQAPDQQWTAQKAWSSVDLPTDHALKDL